MVTDSHYVLTIINSRPENSGRLFRYGTYVLTIKMRVSSLTTVLQSVCKFCMIWFLQNFAVCNFCKAFATFAIPVCMQSRLLSCRPSECAISGGNGLREG